MDVNWKDLTDSDRLVLKSLGIVEPVAKPKAEKKPANPVTVERRLATRNTCPPDYYVSIVQVCSCCSSRTRMLGHMKKRKLSDNYLSLCELEDEVIEVIQFVKSVQYTATCPSCYDVLSKLTVLELCERLVRKHNQG
jgi:hypothetical protein